MAFSELELKRIDKEVGGLCERRSPMEIRDKFSLGYRVKGHGVMIFARRPLWRDPTEWMEIDTVKLKYMRSANEWQMYWQRANGKWVRYNPLPSSRDLKTLLREVESDPLGCFAG